MLWPVDLHDLLGVDWCIKVCPFIKFAMPDMFKESSKLEAKIFFLS